MYLIATFVGTGLLSLVHVFVGQLHFLEKHQRIWKSVAGGVGITYTFLVLLPKVAAAQTVLERASELGFYGFLVHHSYLVALTGLIIYYGMDAAVENVLVQPVRRTGRLAVKALVYAHTGSLSGYYFLVSYLMSKARDAGYIDYVALAMFVIAMLLHYLTIDHGLRHKYGGLYDRLLRWTFVVASMGGWFIGSRTNISHESLALLTSLFAGALIVLTLKEKAPGSNAVHIRAFLTGVTGYALLLLSIEALA